MFKLIKHNMEGMTGVEIYPIITLVIFFLFFTGLIIWVMTTKKNYISEVEQIPLKDNNE